MFSEVDLAEVSLLLGWVSQHSFFVKESYRHSAWNYFTDVIARCDLQRETVKLIISSDIEQAVRRANVALTERN